MAPTPLVILLATLGITHHLPWARIPASGPVPSWYRPATTPQPTPLIEYLSRPTPTNVPLLAGQPGLSTASTPAASSVKETISALINNRMVQIGLLASGVGYGLYRLIQAYKPQSWDISSWWKGTSSSSPVASQNALLSQGQDREHRTFSSQERSNLLQKISPTPPSNYPSKKKRIAKIYEASLYKKVQEEPTPFFTDTERYPLFITLDNKTFIRLPAKNPDEGFYRYIPFQILLKNTYGSLKTGAPRILHATPWMKKITQTNEIFQTQFHNVRWISTDSIQTPAESIKNNLTYILRALKEAGRLPSTFAQAKQDLEVYLS